MNEAAPVSREPIDIGFPAPWNEFVNAHEKFMDRYPTLMQVISDELNGTEKLKSAADMVVFYHSCLSVEDFNELLLLCGPGYGIGGLKILRGLYERCVTQRYLSKHQKEAQVYLDYYAANMWKMFEEAQKVYRGKYKFPGRIKRSIEANYNALPAEVRKMTSWTSKPVPRLALEAGGQLEKLYFSCFHYPTMVAHPTQVGLLSRLDTKQEPPRFKSEMQRTEVDHALSGAHAVVIQIADTHNKHFALGFKERINGCSSDYLEIWKRKPTH